MRTFHVNAQGQQANRKIKWCYGFYCIPDTENIATPEAYEAMRRYFGEQMGPEFADGADVVITSLNEIFAPRPEIIIVDPDAEEVLPAPAPSEVVAEGQSVVHGGPGEIPGTLVVQIGGGGSGNTTGSDRAVSCGGGPASFECIWTKRDDAWYPSCGGEQSYVFYEDKPEEGFNYCYHCGRKVVLA